MLVEDDQHDGELGRGAGAQGRGAQQPQVTARTGAQETLEYA